MKNLLSAVAFLMAGTIQTMAADISFDGLYYPKSSSKPSSCDRIKQELHPRGMIIKKSTVFRGETSCKLLQPRQTNTGMEFISQCESEGEPYRELVTVKRTPTGLKMTADSETTEWVLCSGGKDAAATSSGAASNWSKKSYSNGTIERTLSNNTGDQILFSCTNGGDGTILVMLSSQEFYGGNLDIKVDGKLSNLMTWANSIEVNADCRVCADHYTSLMENIRTGRSMSVVANGGKPVQFDVDGADKVFDQEVCGPKGW